MASRSTCKIVFDHSKKIAAELRPAAGKIVHATALGIEAGAKARVPVKTGTLRRSIHTEMSGPTTARVGTSVFYGPYVEYGTVRMAPRPYLTPAAEAARPRFVADMSKLMA